MPRIFRIPGPQKARNRGALSTENGLARDRGHTPLVTEVVRTP